RETMKNFRIQTNDLSIDARERAGWHNLPAILASLRLPTLGATRRGRVKFFLVKRAWAYVSIALAAMLLVWQMADQVMAARNSSASLRPAVLMQANGGCTTPSFAPAVSFDVGSFPQQVAVGDFNGDGKQDLVTANESTLDVSVLLGDGKGGFGDKTDFS